MIAFPLTQRDQSPVYFSIDNLEPRHARSCAAVRSRDATGIQKQNAATFFISRHMGMTMQNNIDIIGRNIRWNVLQPKFQSAADKIDNQRPLEIAVAIPAHDRDRRTNCAQFIQNSFRANIAQVPNFVRIFRQDRQLLRKLVVRVGQNKDRHLHLRRCFGDCRS